jgi:hypothetical protein
MVRGGSIGSGGSSRKKEASYARRVLQSKGYTCDRAIAAWRVHRTQEAKACQQEFKKT